MENNYEFKVGDKVKIREDSKYYLGTENNPKGTTGTVIEFREGCEHPIQVEWDDMWENCYRDFDLELVNEEPGEELAECPEEFPVNVRHKDDIRHIRDRIYQIREQITSLETEQKHLLEILDKEGFILKDFAAESPIPEGVDVNDWRTWKVGDMVEMLCPWCELKEGGIYPILEIEHNSYAGKMPVLGGGSDKSAWPELEYLRWNSRPTD